MKISYFLIAFAIIGLQGTLSAQPLVLDYMDGTVEVQTKTSSWQSLDVGAKVASDAVLRISDTGLAELSQGTLKIHLGKDGIYQLSKSLAQAKQKPDSKLMGLTGNQIAQLLGTGSPSGVAIANMGARGAAKGDDEGMAWAGDDAASPAVNPLDSIKTLMDQKDWKAALSVTNKAIASQSADVKTLQFDKALILSNMGMAAGSLKALEAAKFRPGDSQYFEAVLLQGSQGLEAQDYELVLNKTDEALQLKPEAGISQNLKLAQALAWKAKGDPAKSKSLLTEVVNLSPKSAPGEEAARLLKS